MTLPLDFGLATRCKVVQLQFSQGDREGGDVYRFNGKGATTDLSGGTLLEISVDGFDSWKAAFCGDYENMGVDGIYACPNPYHLLVIEGSCAFLVDGREPGRVSMADGPNVTYVRKVYPFIKQRLLLLCGWFDIVAIGESGIMWTSPRLVIDGISINYINDYSVTGNGDFLFDRPDLDIFELRLADGHIIRSSDFTDY